MPQPNEMAFRFLGRIYRRHWVSRAPGSEVLSLWSADENVFYLARNAGESPESFLARFAIRLQNWFIEVTGEEPETEIPVEETLSFTEAVEAGFQEAIQDIVEEFGGEILLDT